MGGEAGCTNAAGQQARPSNGPGADAAAGALRAWARPSVLRYLHPTRTHPRLNNTTNRRRWT